MRQRRWELSASIHELVKKISSFSRAHAIEVGKLFFSTAVDHLGVEDIYNQENRVEPSFHHLRT